MVVRHFAILRKNAFLKDLREFHGFQEMAFSELTLLVLSEIKAHCLVILIEMPSAWQVLNLYSSEIDIKIVEYYIFDKKIRLRFTRDFAALA